MCINTIHIVYHSCECAACIALCFPCWSNSLVSFPIVVEIYRVLMHPQPCIICQISDLSQPEVWYLLISDLRSDIFLISDLTSDIFLISDLWRVWLRICTYKLCSTSTDATIVQYNGWSFTFVPIHTGCWSTWLNKADRVVHGACLWVKSLLFIYSFYYLFVMIFFSKLVGCSDSRLFLFCKAKYLVCNIIVIKNVSNGKEKDKIQN